MIPLKMVWKLIRLEWAFKIKCLVAYIELPFYPNLSRCSRNLRFHDPKAFTENVVEVSLVIVTL